MPSSVIYPSYDEVFEIYQKTIDHSGGGLFGIRDCGRIEFVLDAIRNDEYYPDFVAKLTHLVFSFCSGHYFVDGNKRIAIALGTVFLIRNGYLLSSCTFMAEMETVILHVAAGHIKEDLLAKKISSIVVGNEMDEEAKLELAKAMDISAGYSIFKEGPVE